MRGLKAPLLDADDLAMEPYDDTGAKRQSEVRGARSRRAPQDAGVQKEGFIPASESKRVSNSGSKLMARTAALLRDGFVALSTFVIAFFSARAVSRLAESLGASEPTTSSVGFLAWFSVSGVMWGIYWRKTRGRGGFTAAIIFPFGAGLCIFGLLFWAAAS